MPSDTPSRRLKTGPKIILLNRNVDIKIQGLPGVKNNLFCKNIIFWDNGLMI